MFRKTIFWIHLSCGVTAGLVVLMMSVTGVILTYERQMLDWHERGSYAYEPAPGEQRLPVERLIELGSTDGFEASSLILSSDPTDPAILSAGRSGRKHLNPYSGEIHEPASASLAQFLSAVRGCHRWFNVSGDGRSTALWPAIVLVNQLNLQGCLAGPTGSGHGLRGASLCVK